jgi:putative NIF3 family GTP cyclohydrolase 1 type 2
MVYLKAKEIYEHSRKNSTWVNWKKGKTVDQFLAGDPEVEVKGIAVSWATTFSNLQKALDEKCNLFVTHEPLYSAIINKDGIITGGSLFIEPHTQWMMERKLSLKHDDVWVRKQKWVEEKGMTVYRCHDFWDDFPEIGIHGAWAKWLGFTGKPIAAKQYYEVHEVGNITLGELAEKILRKVKLLGQNVVNVVGNLDQKVSRLGLGTGAITSYRAMHEMGADACLVTDDGTTIVESGQWALDSGVSLIIVTHSTAEEPGMRTLAKYLQDTFPNVLVKEIPVGCIYRTIS